MDESDLMSLTVRTAAQVFIFNCEGMYTNGNMAVDSPQHIPGRLLLKQREKTPMMLRWQFWKKRFRNILVSEPCKQTEHLVSHALSIIMDVDIENGNGADMFGNDEDWGSVEAASEWEARILFWGD